MLMGLQVANEPAGQRVMPKMDVSDLQENASRASALLKTMANEWRLLILCHLAEGEKSVGELEQLVDLNQSALSQHLAVLRRHRLVETRRAAQSIFYSLSSDEAASVMDTLYNLYCNKPGVESACR